MCRVGKIAGYVAEGGPPGRLRPSVDGLWRVRDFAHAEGLSNAPLKPYDFLRFSRANSTAASKPIR